jgi:hypothetical protein
MAAKQKPIYAVYCITNFGFGCQPVKALNKKEARKKFRNRFPKRRIIDIEKSSAESHIIKAI